MRHLVSIGIGIFGLARAAWAHHPVPEPEGPGAWLALVVALIAFAVIWGILVLADRRKSSRPERRGPPRT